MVRRTNVPSEVRSILLGAAALFYEPIHMATFNLLISHIQLTEEEMVEFIELDFPSLRSSLNKLRDDKLIDVQMRMTTDPSGKSVNKSYYFVNYKNSINFLICRLSYCLKKIEDSQNQDIINGNYKCEECNETFRDVDIMTLFDMDSQCIKCKFCGGNVEIVEDKAKRHSAREEIAFFNNRIMEPFISIFNKIKEMNILQDTAEQSAPNNKINVESDLKTNDISIIIDTNATWNTKHDAKEKPLWLNSNSTDSTQTALTQTMAPGRVPGCFGSNNIAHAISDIMSLLMTHEHCIDNSLAAHQQRTKSISYTNVYVDSSMKVRSVTQEIVNEMSEKELKQFEETAQLCHYFYYDS